MPDTAALGALNDVRVTDLQVNKPAGTDGSPEIASRDILHIEANGLNRKVRLYGANGGVQSDLVPVFAGQGPDLAGMQCAFSDFNGASLAAEGTVVADAGGTLGQTISNGHALIAPDGDDNDEAYFIGSTFAAITATKQAYLETRFKLTNGVTAADLSAFVGLMDAAAANSLVDDTGALKASWDGAVLHKDADDTAWFAASSNGSAGTRATTGVSYATGEYLTLAIAIGHVAPDDAANVAVQFFVNGALTNTQYVALASLANLGFAAGIKCGAAYATTEPRLDIDYYSLVATR